MTACIRPVGDGHGLIIDKSILDRLRLRDGSAVSVTLSPDGTSVVVTPVEGADAEAAAHKAQVRAAGEYVQERQAGILKKLAE